MKKLIVILIELLLITSGTYAKKNECTTVQVNEKTEVIAGTLYIQLTNYELFMR